MWRNLPDSEKLPFIEEVKSWIGASNAGQGGQNPQASRRADLQPDASIRGEDAGVQRGVQSAQLALPASAAGAVRRERHGAAGSVFAGDESARPEGNDGAAAGEHSRAVGQRVCEARGRGVLCSCCTRRASRAWSRSTARWRIFTRVRRGGDEERL